MHEFSIANSLLEAAEAEAGRCGARRITSIRCRIGVMRQVDPLLMSEVFDIAKQGSKASDATLDVTSVGTRLDCRKCGLTASLNGLQLTCPNCGSTNIRLDGGDELELTSLEIEVNGED